MPSRALYDQEFVMINIQKLFSVDAETNGLYGNTFAISVVVYEQMPTIPGPIAQIEYAGNRGFELKEIIRFEGRIPNSFVTNEWVKKNVLPALEGMKITHQTPEELEEAFWKFWIENKEDSTVIAHCGSPVESGLFRRCVERNLEERAFSGPYPAIHDVATILLALGEEADSVDSYIKKYKLSVPFVGSTHHPSYDAIVAAEVYKHAWKRLIK